MWGGGGEGWWRELSARAAQDRDTSPSPSPSCPTTGRGGDGLSSFAVPGRGRLCRRGQHATHLCRPLRRRCQVCQVWSLTWAIETKGEREAFPSRDPGSDRSSCVTRLRDYLCCSYNSCRFLPRMLHACRRIDDASWSYADYSTCRIESASFEGTLQPPRRLSHSW